MDSQRQIGNHFLGMLEMGSAGGYLRAKRFRRSWWTEEDDSCWINWGDEV